MILPADLIHDFAKLTNDDKRNVTDDALYGTIVDYNDSKWVKIDGSDLLTPISTITNMEDGDRVVVSIKNHQAMVSGNLSYPSTTVPVVEGISGAIAGEVAGKIVAEEIDAEFIKVAAMLADYIKVDQLDALIINSDQINAKFIDVEELEAEKIVVGELIADSIKAERIEVEELIADSIKAERIEVEELIADSIVAERAEIDELIANNANITNATIGNLEADIADINTLIFGMATGDVIHVNFANSVVQLIGDAQIKSAQIESVSASKITAGDIITNSVKVMSEDGSLVIKDETIQISDDTRVRVQIGKDAADDYSINIWDADGNLMFSEGGITDSAIKESIIRNDMVSDTANIAASKLNIDSLFTVINDDGSNTIKSNKIWLDEENQSLEVSFKKMTTDVTEMGEVVSSQGTQISVIQGQISNKIWQQDIDTAKDEFGNNISTLNTQYSELTQTLDGINSTVASHTSELAKAVKEVRIYYHPLASGRVIVYNVTPEMDNNLELSLPYAIDLTDGMTYTVIWGGVSYSCAAYKYSVEGRDIILLGNYSALGGPDSDIPFLILTSPTANITSVIGNRNAFSIIEGAHGAVTVLPTTKPPYIGNNRYVGPERVSLELGKKYIVTWNGSRYSCTSFEATFEGSTGIGIGNYGLLTGGVSTGEPFVLGVVYGVDGFTTIALDGTNGDGNLELSITTDVASHYTPTTYPPDGKWSETEPTEGAMYTVMCTVYADGTYIYSDVSVNTAMELAVNNQTDIADLAINVDTKYETLSTKIDQTDSSISLIANRTTTNETDIAQLKITADGLSVALDELAIGGRNLVAGTDRTTVYSGNKGTSTYKDVWTGKTIDIPTATEYIVSFDAKADVAQTIKCFFYSPNTTTKSESSTGGITTNPDGTAHVDITTNWARYWVKWTQTVPTAVKNIIVGRNETTNNIHIRAVKFEEGHVPTSWTPAPEDVDSDISNATKTATNFMSYDGTNGLLVGNKTSGSWSGNRAQITSNAFNILNSSGKQLASFGETVTIGKNSSTDRYVYIDNDSVDICHGTITLTSISDNKIVLGNAISKYDNLNKPVGENLTIDANGLVFRKGPNEIVAAFKTDEIVLGADTSTSRIILCGGAGAIYAGGLSNSDVWDMLQLDSTNLRLTGITETLTEAVLSIGGGNGTLRGTSHQIHGSNTSGAYIGDYMQSYISSSFAQRNGTTTGQAYMGTTVYADYPDISTATINATDGTNTSYISVCPTYIDIDTTTLIIGGNTSIAGKLIVTGDISSGSNAVLHAGNYSTYAAPKSHATTANTYGAANNTNYGHVRLSDTTSSESSTSGGYAATPKAVKTAYDLANAALPKAGGTVTGKTTFTTDVEIQGNLQSGKLEIYHATPYIDFHFGKSTADYTSRILENASGVLTIGMGKGVTLQTKNEAIMLYDTTGSGYNAIFRPNTGGTCTLGAASYKWFAVYAANGTIQTSDRREKENIIPLGVNPVATYGMRSVPEEQIDIHSELFDRLQPVQYNFINGDGRTNYGLIAQDVISAMEELGIGENELGLVHHEWHTDEETGEEKDTYGIAYANLIALLIHEVQKLKTEVNKSKGEQNNG